MRYIITFSIEQHQNFLRKRLRRFHLSHAIQHQTIGKLVELQIECQQQIDHCVGHLVLVVVFGRLLDQVHQEENELGADVL